MKKILVVDDNEDIRVILKKILEKENYNVITASNSDECIKKVQEEIQKPDLILLDIMMPGSPVKEVTDNIHDIKIVYLTAVRVSDEEKNELLKKSNVVDFIPKPFIQDRLIEQIRRIIGDAL